MSQNIFVRSLKITIAFTFLMTALTAYASPSNKWRIQFSGKANSDGSIVITLTPIGGEPITAEVAVENNTGENGVAKTVVKGLKAQLSRDLFHIERDDGEDVLIKKRHGTANFDLEIVSNSVDGVRINPEHE
ncbi:MAG TPA: hypothetical protein VJ984_11205 [Xanthomonadales bacterium]|nr:hypothetical protein [Xanthomonadales bacterium]